MVTWSGNPPVRFGRPRICSCITVGESRSRGRRADRRPIGWARCDRDTLLRRHVPASIDAGFQTPMLPREATRFKPAPRGRSFSVGYLTWADDLILLSITVIVDMISTVSAPRCFRSLTDAYLRPGPDRR